jgi:hypothetical protein
VKKLSVVVAGTGQIRDIEIQPGTTAGDVLNQLDLRDYLLSKGPNDPFFANADTVTPQFLVIIQIFIPQRQPVHPLRHQLLHPVLNALGLPVVPKAGRKLTDNPRPLLHFAQQQPAGVARDRSAVKSTPHFTLVQGMKFQKF